MRPEAHVFGVVTTTTNVARQAIFRLFTLFCLIRNGRFHYYYFQTRVANGKSFIVLYWILGYNRFDGDYIAFN
jgi:hypothetical protein